TSLTWSTTEYTDTYELEIATNPSFSPESIVETASLSTPNYTPQNLAIFTVYYWRVSNKNTCGTSAASDYFSFQTENPTCLSFESTDVPILISANDEGVYNSNLQIDPSLLIQDINLSVSIAHTWVGDLIAELRSPSNEVYRLFDRPGSPASNFGCDEDNLSIILDDQADNSANDLESTCNGGGLAIAGNYAPIDAFGNLNGQDAQGVWTLSVEDVFDQDGGSIDAWSLEVCVETSNVSSIALDQQALTLAQGTSAIIGNTLLNATSVGSTAMQLQYTLIRLPQYGSLSLNGMPLGIGSIFTQSDIDDGLLSYSHDNSDTQNDDFDFEVINNDGFWSNSNTFPILIFDEVLSASALLTQAISCFDEQDASVTVSAFGGQAPYTYSLNGIDFQSSNLFTDLAAGMYTFTIMDANNNLVSTNTVDIINPTILLLELEVQNDTITAMASGGSGMLQYSINGVDFQMDALFTDLSNGDYTITVIDENECTTTAQATIAVNTLAVDISVINEISCVDANDGRIEVSVSGGMAPYQYRLNGMGDYQTSNTFTDLSPGSYFVEVLDADNFTQLTPTINLNNPTALFINTLVEGNTLTIIGTGGMGNLLYSIDGINFQPENIFTDLENGNYTVFVQDEALCTISAEVSIEVTSTQQIDTELRLSIQPNPNRGSFTIELQQANPQVIEIRVHDMIGQLLYQQNFGRVGQEFQQQIQLSQLSAGVYLLSIANEQSQTSRRLVITP
ncbi:MAG: T9SS type A sorting domain-containing protein, partial [Bacteroidota bacterium]